MIETVSNPGQPEVGPKPGSESGFESGLGPGLAGKVALITGAAQRIGAQIARRLHAEGVDLLLHYRKSADAAQALADELDGARADSIRLVQAELLDPGAPALLMEAVQAFRGQLDILVNNASSFYPTPLGQFIEVKSFI